MKKPLVASMLMSTLLAGSTIVGAGQSLADVARKEEERRKTLAGGAKVYTNHDLAPVPGGGPSLPLPIPGDDGGSQADETEQAVKPASDTSAAQTSEPLKPREKRPEAYWRERSALIRGRLEQLRGDAAAIEGRMKMLRGELASATPEQAAQLNADLQQAGESLERFQTERRHIEAEWAAFQAAAHQTGVPAAWLR